MPQTTLVFGGVNFFNRNDINSMSTVKQNGETYYVVSFKSGAELKYPQQKNNKSPENGGPSVGTYRDCHYGNPCYGISHVSGATFKGGASNDDVSLMNCTNTVVNVNGGGNDCVSSQNCSKTRVIADKNDTVYKPNGPAYIIDGKLDVTF